mmetsp:Transcript_39053/g.107597  ORF Transcript_39053/g.107597 Transcript_39053/m.107597 type:complete len:230 (-) Transcript_39053:84-773(-)
MDAWPARSAAIAEVSARSFDRRPSIANSYQDVPSEGAAGSQALQHRIVPRKHVFRVYFPAIRPNGPVVGHHCDDPGAVAGAAIVQPLHAQHQTGGPVHLLVLAISRAAEFPSPYEKVPRAIGLVVRSPPRRQHELQVDGGPPFTELRHDLGPNAFQWTAVVEQLPGARRKRGCHTMQIPSISCAFQLRPQGSRRFSRSPRPTECCGLFEPIPECLLWRFLGTFPPCPHF